ncbi:hypothetical protein ACEQ8H_001199 [Pleosporales sp. CAS-2024a]
MPSELQTVAATTRWTTQLPVSAMPALSLLSSQAPSFRTVVSRRGAEVGSSTQGSAVDAGGAGGASWCGESGNFTLGFDDTTVRSSGDGVLVANGLKNPYHHLFYANGYTNVPDKWEPYPAMSQPNVAMFLPLSGPLLPNQAFAGTLLPGEVGAGPRASVDAYWFNAHSGYFGCALSGLAPCVLRVSGFRWDARLQTEVLVAEQNATLPACPLYVDCRLRQVVFGDGFRALSGIQFRAYTATAGTAGVQVAAVHMMDDVQLEWYNTSCAAGIVRMGHW